MVSLAAVRMHDCKVEIAELGSCLNSCKSCSKELLLQMCVSENCAARCSAKGLEVEMCEGIVPVGLVRLNQRMDTGA